MEREQTKIQIGLRVPECMNEQLDEQARKIGISKNSFLAVLIDLGLKAYEVIPKIAQDE